MEAVMRTRIGWLVGFLISGIVLFSISCGEKAKDRQAEDAGKGESFTAADTLNWNVFVAYLQDHFDDFHDVTMRYHDRDHTINGVVKIRMTWKDGRLVSAETVSNETGNADLPKSLIEKMREWRIEGLEGPAEIVLPVDVKIVGLDDPAFPNTAILSGQARDTDGNPLHGAMVVVKPKVAGPVYRAQTNREGIFVKTLIPPGTWDLECWLDGYEPDIQRDVDLSAGQHMRVKFTLKKK
jgi:hypothetical protein